MISFNYFFPDIEFLKEKNRWQLYKINIYNAISKHSTKFTRNAPKNLTYIVLVYLKIECWIIWYTPLTTNMSNSKKLFIIFFFSGMWNSREINHTMSVPVTARGKNIVYLKCQWSSNESLSVIFLNKILINIVYLSIRG